MSNRSTFEEDVLIEALALAEEERLVFVQRRCGTDEDTAGRIVAFLQGYQTNSAYLETPAAVALLRNTGRTFRELTPEPQTGDRIGRYHLLKRIGDGGFGVVYLAEQEEPVRREVALKIIRLGMDTREFIARFEAERQALAQMDHPNIARVFDAGATETGRPYLVMELIRGIPITNECDDTMLPVTARLEMFLQVCGAIQHAHQKGIIHRDLKPSNILVERQDPNAVGTPKVIDFGIAKATREPLHDKTLLTRCQTLMGTPAYTSPEQLELSGLGVDTRSDIYSLGVLLYELLTGHQPFERVALERASLEEMRRVIREVDPPRPSQRIAALSVEDRAHVSQRRGIDPEKLGPFLRSDLDWIVMRCLEKDPTRRYATANALAVDLRRFLRNEPVLARSPSRSYQLRKFVRRNRVMVIAGVTIALALVAGLTLGWVGLARAMHQQQLAESARREAEDLVSFMARDLRPELQRAGRLPLTTQIAEKVVNYFTGLPPDLTNASTERNRAVALEALAYVRSAAGDQPAAASLWSEALAARRRALAAEPNDPVLAVELALTEYIDVSEGHPMLASRPWGAQSPASDALLEAIVHRARAARLRALDNEEVSRTFAQLLACRCRHLNERMILPQEALALGAEAAALYRTFLARSPADTAVGAEFIRLLITLSVTAQQSGESTRGIQLGEEAMALADQAVQANPGNIELLENAAFAAKQLCYRHDDLAMERAMAAEAVARERWRGLMQLDPGNFFYRSQFAQAHSVEAEFRYSRGRKLEAGAAAERYVELMSAVAKSPDDFLVLQTYSARLGSLAAQFGRREEALERDRQMREWHLRYLSSMAPDAARLPRIAIEYQEARCMTLDQLGDWPEAEREARAMIALVNEARKKAGVNGERGKVDTELAWLEIKSFYSGYVLGRALLGQGRPEQAAPVLERVVHDLEHADGLLFPDHLLSGALILSQVPLAKALIATSHVQPARTLLEKNLAVSEGLANATPALLWEIRVAAAHSDFLLASVLNAQDPREAERRRPLLARAAAVLESQLPENPLSLEDAELLMNIRDLSASDDLDTAQE